MELWIRAPGRILNITGNSLLKLLKLLKLMALSIGSLSSFQDFGWWDFLHGIIKTKKKISNRKFFHYAKIEGLNNE